MSVLLSQADPTDTIQRIDGYTGPAEKMPEFVGGQEYMYKYIYGNLRYPKAARKNNIEGTVIVSFTVDVDGLVRNIEIVRGIGGGCDEEVERVMGLMSTRKLWRPGRHEYKAVPVTFTLPFKFDLEDSRKK